MVTTAVEQAEIKTADLMRLVDWQEVKRYDDITYHMAEGIARIAFDRPNVRNAFRPKTIDEMTEALLHAWHDGEVGVLWITANGPSSKDGIWSFCAGGDQKVRGHSGYVGDDGVPRLNVLQLQRYIRNIPKPVIAVVPGFAIGGGHVLHVCCDLTISSDNAIYGQTGPIVGSFDAGFGSSFLAAQVGQKKGARDLVLVPSIQRRASPGNGHGQYRRAVGGTGARSAAVVARNTEQKPAGAALYQSRLECRARWSDGCAGPGG